jgi:hypothetical protein
MQCEDGTGKMPNPWSEEEEEFKEISQIKYDTIPFYSISRLVLY